jgi:hypothetical protein
MVKITTYADPVVKHKKVLFPYFKHDKLLYYSKFTVTASEIKYIISVCKVTDAIQKLKDQDI